MTPVDMVLCIFLFWPSCLVQSSDHSVLTRRVRRQWIPPPPPLAEQRLEEEIALDLGDEYESALGEANENELVDLAGERHGSVLTPWGT